VFLIVLSSQPYAAVFGPSSSAPYLSQALEHQGELLVRYYAVAHQELPNGIALLSGQGPTSATAANCPSYTDLTATGVGADQQVSGQGCVYPSTPKTLAGQLTAKHKTWRAYVEGTDEGVAGGPSACAHPVLGAADPAAGAQSGQPASSQSYATYRDPFVYFHSVIDERTFCDKHVVALGSPSGVMPAAALKGETGLATDLASVTKTPRFSFITPNLCNDGHDYPCVNQPSGASALADIDSFLETWVPKITSSQAYRENGLLEIVFDEASNSETEACCEEMPGPGSPSPGITGPGGGRVGAVLLSPFIKPATVSTTPYNHYSSLASWESLLGLPRLAYAASVPSVFGTDVFG
jgi:hypothetical protein